MAKKGGKSALHIGGLVLTAAFMAGCTLSGGKDTGFPPPAGAELSVTPTTLEFTIKDPYDQSSYIGAFEVKNAGDGKLVWYVEESCDFARCDPECGSVTDDANTVTVSLDSKSVQSGINGAISIESNGGECRISLIVDVLILVGGRVFDAETGEAVAGARISFGPASPPALPAAVSDLEGHYEVWAHEKDVLDGPDIVVNAFKDGYCDYYYKGKPIIRQNPPGYAHDLAMIQD